MIEGVQYKLLRFCAYKLQHPMRYDDHNYPPLLKELSLDTLKNRRIILDITFLLKLINNNNIYCTPLLGSVHFYTPSRHLRSRATFHIPTRNSKYSVADTVKHF